MSEQKKNGPSGAWTGVGRTDNCCLNPRVSMRTGWYEKMNTAIKLKWNSLYNLFGPDPSRVVQCFPLMNKKKHQ